MKKIILLTLVYLPISVFCQSAILGKIKQKAKTRTDQHAEVAIDKSMNKAEEEIKDQAQQQTKKENAVPEESKIINNEKPQVVNLKSYSRYDFIPGERILYAEDFSTDELGELPLKWTTNNRGESVMVENVQGKWMRVFPGSRFASPASQKLPENFTMEVDILLQFGGEEGYVYPELEIKLLDLLPSDDHARSYVVNQDAGNEVALVLLPGGAGKPLNVSLKTYANGSSYFSNQVKELQAASDNNGKPLHISVWVQKERIRYWINGDKVFDIPQAVPVKAAFNRVGFSVESSLYSEEQLGLYVSNIKVAEGTPDMRSKLLTEGRLVTTGILFDANSDRMKPESAGVLKEIAATLKDNHSLKVKIIGHTDGDGDEVQNLDLSKRRAVTVQNILNAEFGIDISRLQTGGEGETTPVADNNTKEGKAKNRRVEFIRL